MDIDTNCDFFNVIVLFDSNPFQARQEYASRIVVVGLRDCGVNLPRPESQVGPMHACMYSTCIW